tara:strand:+ start:2181 stop:2351 length:171 start_codon:yes stop_codon:yes gene_type:complete
MTTKRTELIIKQIKEMHEEFRKTNDKIQLEKSIKKLPIEVQELYDEVKSEMYENRN